MGLFSRAKKRQAEREGKPPEQVEFEENVGNAQAHVKAIMDDAVAEIRVAGWNLRAVLESGPFGITPRLSVDPMSYNEFVMYRDRKNKPEELSKQDPPPSTPSTES